MPPIRCRKPFDQSSIQSLVKYIFSHIKFWIYYVSYFAGQVFSHRNIYVTPLFQIQWRHFINSPLRIHSACWGPHPPSYLLSPLFPPPGSKLVSKASLYGALRLALCAQEGYSLCFLVLSSIPSDLLDIVPASDSFQGIINEYQRCLLNDKEGRKKKKR